MLNALKRACRRVLPKYGISSPILVHQMGKVGSKSVEAGLKALRLSVPIYHSHYIDDFDRLEQRYRKIMADPTVMLELIEDSRKLRRRIDDWRGPPWNLVSLVREPISRDISGFFFDLLKYAPEYHDHLSRGVLSTEDLIELFLERFMKRDQRAGDSSSKRDWFDDQMRGPFGIDVYAEPFPIEQGYAIYEGRRARLLLLRLEDLDRCGADAFREFLRIPNFRADHVNGAEVMPYSGPYDQFKRTASLPASTVEELCDHRWARHFYRPEELERAKGRWAGRVAS